jgi:endonuclease YncB( thermonuclease family)
VNMLLSRRGGTPIPTPQPQQPVSTTLPTTTNNGNSSNNVNNLKQSKSKVGLPSIATTPTTESTTNTGSGSNNFNLKQSKSKVALPSIATTPTAESTHKRNLEAELEDAQEARAKCLLDNETLRTELQQLRAREASLLKELEMTKKLYKEEKEQKNEFDSDWVSDNGLASNGDVSIMKKQMGVMAKTLARLRKQTEDLEDEVRVAIVCFNCLKN